MCHECSAKRWRWVIGDWSIHILYGTIYWGFNVHPIYQLFWARKQGFQNFAIYTHVIPRTMSQYLTNMGIETPRILIQSALCEGHWVWTHNRGTDIYWICQSRLRFLRYFLNPNRRDYALKPIQSLATVFLPRPWSPLSVKVNVNPAFARKGFRGCPLLWWFDGRGWQYPHVDQGETWFNSPVRAGHYVHKSNNSWQPDSALT